MAVSPITNRAPPEGEKSQVLKSKTLTLLSKPDGKESSPHSDPSDDDAGGELAERMNEQNRRRYVKGKKLGEGTYAIVYKGHLRDDPTQLVAIKKIKIIADSKDGIPLDAIREVRCLQELSHPNVISLRSVFSTKDQNLNLVLEYLPLGDLEVLIRDTKNVHYSLADIKAWMGMLCRGVWFCHENFILHRDIKPNNLLIAADGEVKLADFGLARSFADPYMAMSHQVITRWYRPPELFYKARYYSGKVDVWSVGCVFAELVLRTPFMAGNSDIHQLELICQALGAPTEENWPGVTSLDAYVPIEKDKQTPARTKADFMQYFPTIGTDGVDLLASMLALDPNKRATASECLHHEWWTAEPRPSKKESLPKRGGGESRIGEDLKRRGGELDEENGRLDKVARKLDFSSLKK